MTNDQQQKFVQSAFAYVTDRPAGLDPKVFLHKGFLKLNFRPVLTQQKLYTFSKGSRKYKIIPAVRL